MEQRFFDLLHGYVRIRITGTSYDRFLNLCAYHGIRLWKLLPANGAYEACISGTDFLKLKAIIRKSHAHIHITKRFGLPFFIHRYRARWACAGGALAALLFMLWLSSHIWDIRIVGNLSQTDDVIFEYLETEGISHGIWKNQVDTQALSDEIRNYFTRFSWVSAELKGTCLTIYVKEGTADTQINNELQENMANTDSTQTDNVQTDCVRTGLAASKAGTVLSVYVRKGVAMVTAGDEVAGGDLLVSGRIPVYGDDGEVVSWQIVSADADIVLRTQTEYYDELEYETIQKNYTGRKKIRYLIRILGIPFSISGLSAGTSDSEELWDVTGELTQLKLSENFYLPVYFYKYSFEEYENLKYWRTEEEAKKILEDNLSLFKKKLQEKGVQIFENNVTIDLHENTVVAQGYLITDESAAIQAVEEEQTE
ncbi:MAG: sporulation protein YqfD [Lachnospiraceae bacterium]|nr:sporulation protein YqfD [Lachnospiraceae bacterium]